MTFIAVSRQIGSVARVGIATIPKRLGASAVVVVGIAGVVGVLVGLLAIGEGFEKTLTQTGNDQNLIVLQAGAHSEAASTLGRETLAIVSQTTLQGQAWTVVGIFDSGDAHNSELWADTDVLGPAFRRANGKSSLLVRLNDSRSFNAFQSLLSTDPRLRVDVLTTRQYYSRQSERLARMIRVFGVTIASIMALGAMFGALNTMYSAVATRAREIATLRAIGFRSVPVIVSVLIETMLLAAVGGIMGAGIAWLLFDGFSASTMGSGGQIMFAFDVSSELLRKGLLAALSIGFVGGLLPAVRAARMPVATALREL